jgi:hypothetical protein
MRTHTTSLLRTLVLLLCTVLFTGVSLADKIVLKDGRVVEGTIVREIDELVWIKFTVAGIEREEVHARTDITTIERSDAAKPDAAKADAKANAPAVPASGAYKTPKAAIITLGDEENGHTVGIYMTAHQLEQMIPILEKELGTDGTGVVVLRIHSGGGLLLEVQKLSDVIHNEYKKRWRTVAWIDSAISAAAMTAHCLEEIYFTSQGNYGAATGYSGPLVAIKGRDLEEVLYQMEKVSARGGHNPLIARAMQIQQPLSVTVKPNGDVEYYGDTKSGDIVVNPAGEVLTFNSVTAARIKFSRGTCDTIPELTKAMGYQELDWIGQEVRGVPWKISTAEKENIAWRKRVKQDEEMTRKYITDYQTTIEMARGSPPEERGKFLGRARTALERIRAMVKNNPNFSFLTFNMLMDDFDKWYRDQEKLIRELARR